MPSSIPARWLAVGLTAALLSVACATQPRASLVVRANTKPASATPGTKLAGKPSAKPSASLADDGHGHGHEEPGASPSARPSAGDGHDHEHDPAADPTLGPSTVSYKSTVVPMLRAHCASCHVPGGGVPEHAHWFDAKGEPQHQVIKEHAGVMVRLMRSGEMPKGSPSALPQALIDELDAWRKAGAPEN